MLQYANARAVTVRHARAWLALLLGVVAFVVILVRMQRLADDLRLLRLELAAKCHAGAG